MTSFRPRKHWTGPWELHGSWWIRPYLADSWDGKPLCRCHVRRSYTTTARREAAMDDECLCGHVEDEHDPRSRSCDIEGCDCGCFESILASWGDGDNDGTSDG